MIDDVSLMRKAKLQLSDNWTNAVLATLIFSVLFSAASATYVVELLVGGPLIFGYTLFMSCLVDTRTNNLSLLFKGFDRFVETLVAGLLISVATSIGMAILIVPGIIVSLGFAMTFFIMADDANISGIDAIKMSWNMMDGHKWDLFYLWVRFIGWALLCLFTCGIGLLWFMPYFITANLNFYRNLRYGTF